MKTREQLAAKQAHLELQLRKLKRHPATHVIGDVISQTERELTLIKQALIDIENNKDESQ